MNSSDFFDNSIDTKHFQIENVSNDNACFYRALSNSLAFSHKSHMCKDILKNFEFDFYNKVSEFYNNPNWAEEGIEQSKLAKKLQAIIYNFVINNGKDMIIPIDESMGLTLEELIKLTHNITYDLWVNLYNHFAGDLIVDSNISIIKD